MGYVACLTQAVLILHYWMTQLHKESHFIICLKKQVNNRDVKSSSLKA